MNREGWLTELAREAEAIFKGFVLHPYRLTCGWPSRFPLSRRQRRIGECHGLESSKGKVHEIFISPLLDDPAEVAGVVCHEMVHVAAGIPAGHKGKFIRICRHIGLTKNKPTSAAPGERLAEQLAKLTEKLGRYPHEGIVPTVREVKPSTSVKVTCPTCGCNFRLSMKWFFESGVPTCGCGTAMTTEGVEDE